MTFATIFPSPNRSAEVRRSQVDNSLRMVPAASLGGLFNAGVAGITLWSSGWHGAILAWFAALCTLNVARIVQWRGFVDASPGIRNIEADERMISRLAIGNGALWSLGIALAAIVASPSQFNMIAMLTGGMMGAAVMTYGPLPRAAFGYIIPFAIGCLAAWTISPAAPALTGILLIVSYVAVLARTILTNEKIFIAKVRGEIELRESAETVQLLLNDFESQSADWLWAVDEQGRIMDPAPRFAEASHRDAELLTGSALVDLFDPGPERDMLAEHILGRFAFRDIALQLTIAGSPHWWILSARPHSDGGLRGVASDITAQKRAEERVSYLAHYDGLTELSNRFLFNETLARALHRIKPKRMLAVLCLDLDQFKSVNDTLGHPIGDKLLYAVARRIEGAVRENDMVARLGGDEFAVLINNPRSTKDVEACAQRIILALAEPIIIDGMQVMASTSIGIAMARDPAAEASELMKMGDLALYSAKNNGRNRFAHFEPGMDELARERRDLEMDMRAALVRNEFELHYQPLINVETREVVSYEALVRWKHPTRGVVMPGTFIPLAEETGLIVQLGEWVIRKAICEAATWKDDIGISVNLSPAQMRSSNLITTVVNALAGAGLAPERLELEITESVLMHDSDVNIAILHKLRGFGVRISLDDFGTGYSSLNYLRSFPFDKIKIDRCFVEEIDEREDCRAIIRAVTGLADSLGMKTTAEGVESTEQLERLRIEGCTEVQGFLFSRPVAIEELSNLRMARSATQDIDILRAEVIPLLPAIDTPVMSAADRRKRA